MKKIIATALLGLSILGLGAAHAAGICTQDGQPADPCYCRQTDDGLVCTRTGERLSECCCK